MSPQVYAIGVAGMLAVAGIGGYLHERDKRVRTEALAEAKVDSITRAVRADSVEMAYRDSVADERLEEAAHDRAEAERRAEQAERRAQRAAQDRDSRHGGPGHDGAQSASEGPASQPRGGGERAP